MDRYEQRALLRRTIRAFDAARNGVVGIWSYRVNESLAERSQII
jgi:hypothetical protein